MKKEMNNKGFSLVELIIVIAIMAVLVGVLAPQYLKYVSNSKVSTDITNAGNLNTAFSAAIADGTITTMGSQGGAGGATITGDNGNLSITAFPASKVDPAYSWTVTYDETGVTKIELNGEEIFPDSENYKTNHWK